MTARQEQLARPGFWPILRRALQRRCPNCGQGKLFASYLKQVEHCAACGERYAHIRSDDAAPWLTILVVGHIVIPLVIFTEKRVSWPEWESMTVWPGLTLVLALLILPYSKAIFLSAIWATKGPGSEQN